ncbi:ribokinase [Pistricoccus aurantiacus]|uniref:Ribokinase n=1 Tax=Pistricoccus aurantiacus TaxID=1883414 RepID=A0A5B8SYM2_9GAMM|nr:ribokinase [Pistricoccus aurantiacus]QEA39938.1 ribokinase [Pistricoccus aurantiacus]
MRTDKPLLYNLGSINIDHVYRVPHLVRPGETLSSTDFQQVLGGKGANQSLAMARAGGRVQHWGRLGSMDRWALEILVSSGVDTSAVELASEPSGHALIQVDDQGENAIILFPGANHGFNEATLGSLIENAQLGGWLVLQNECNGLDSALRQAAARGLQVAFNPAPMDAKVQDLPLEHCRLLFINRGEAASLTGLPWDSDADALLDRLAKRLPETELVLTLGVDGVCHHYREQRLCLPAHSVQVVDTTAAGDTFIGYFMADRQAGGDIESSLQRASVAAALSVQRTGAAPSIPLATEVDAALAQWPGLFFSRT